MISAIKFGTAQFLTSNPPANTVVLAFDFDDKKLYLMDSEQRVLLSDVVTSFLFGPDGKIKPEFIESGAIAEVPTKTSQLINDSGYVTKDTKSLTYYLTKEETIKQITDYVVRLNTKVDAQFNDVNKEIAQLKEQIAGLSGTYVYIGKINISNPSQGDLTEAALQLKGNVAVGYVLVDASGKEWYYDGAQWNDFGSSSGSLVSWNDILDKPDVVEYQKYQEKDASITLTNHNSLFGTDTNGFIYNLAMVSKWDKADFGSASLQMNLNSPSGIITVNDEKILATTDQIPTDYVVSSDLTDVVRYQNLDNDKKTESIVLKNDQAVFGIGLSGGLYNLAMVSRWNKADFGSAAIELNLNAKDGKVTINDDKVLATTDQIPTDYVVSGDIADVVRYQNLSDKKFKSILLDNNQAIFGTDVSGSTYNLAMVSEWNKADFGSTALQFNINSINGLVTINDDKVIATVDQIPEVPDMSNVVKYQNLGEYKTESILLKNDQAIFGTDLSGSIYNLAMVSRWNKADYGSESLELNLNAASGIVTINDDKVVATTEYVDNKISDVAETATDAAASMIEESIAENGSINNFVSSSIENAIGTEDELTNTLNAIAALSLKIENI